MLQINSLAIIRLAFSPHRRRNHYSLSFSVNSQAFSVRRFLP
jgi:hypothetical protein